MTFDLEELAHIIRKNPRLVGVDDFEISLQQSSYQSIQYVDGYEKGSLASTETWVSLRVIRRKCAGRAVAFLHSMNVIDQLVEQALFSADCSSPDPWFRFPIFKEYKQSLTQNNSKTNEAFESPKSLKEKLPYAAQAFEEQYETKETEYLLARKLEKPHLNHKNKIDSFQFSLLNSNIDEEFWIKEFRGQTEPILQKERLLLKMSEKSHSMKQAKKSNKKIIKDMILSPQVASKMLEYISWWFYKNQSTLSPLDGLLDKNFFSKNLTLIDNPLIPGGYRTLPFDSEGNMTSSVTLVEQGTLKDFLYNSYYAFRDNRLSTGHFFRVAPSHNPEICHSNFYIQPSKKDLNELIKNVHDGIYIGFLDWSSVVPNHQNEVLLKGLGWSIQRGQIESPISSIYLHVDLVNIFKNVCSVASDLHFYGAFGSPSIWIEKII